MRTKTIEESIKHKAEQAMGVTVVEYQPGNGTRYVASFCRLPHDAGEFVGCQAGSWLVALVDGALAGRCCVLAPGGFLSRSYVAEKLGLRPREDADDLAVLTELFGHILGRPTPSAQDEHGPFSPELQVEITHNE